VDEFIDTALFFGEYGPTQGRKGGHSESTNNPQINETQDSDGTPQKSQEHKWEQEFVNHALKRQGHRMVGWMGGAE